MKTVGSQHFHHPVLGEIAIKALRTATRITAHWKTSQLLSLTIPKGLTATQVMNIIEKMLPDLLRTKPQGDFFTPGWRYSTPERDFVVVAGTDKSGIRRIMDPDNKEVRFIIPPEECDTGSGFINDFINRNLDDYARIFAEAYLLPDAFALANRLKVNPTSISISYGQKVLGRCNSRGEILLSRNLVFYPLELRNYVVAHEFAHLTHMNHSQAFYDLLNRYVDGQLDSLLAALKKHKLPFKK
ncbi:MAG: M48 family metallopeptidase [Muribaculaceae bacterium]|nr:M48 family metallopeptidase [Muribaculaceae bacterium]